MSGLSNMKKRLVYHGGLNQGDRIVADKKRSLSKALLYSYQAATAILSDGREFRCLINPNKLNMEADDKVLSMPFEDVCLNKNTNTTPGTEATGIKPGEVIVWKETETYWLVYNQYLQERAYFRGDMRQCNTLISVDGINYWVYIKGPSEKGVDWQQSKRFIFNDLNYTLEMYISKDEKTNEFFQRFTKIQLDGKPWEVQAVDRISTEGILAVYLKEDYSNEFSENQIEESAPDNSKPSNQGLTRIIGQQQVRPFDIHTYSIEGASNGTWSLSNGRAIIRKQNGASAEIEIVTGKSGSVTLTYTSSGRETKLNISILSL